MPRFCRMVWRACENRWPSSRGWKEEVRVEERPGAELPCLGTVDIGAGELSAVGASCALWGDEEHPPPRLCTKSWKPEMPLDIVKYPLRVKSPRGDPPTQRNSVLGRGNNQHEGSRGGNKLSRFSGNRTFRKWKFSRKCQFRGGVQGGRGGWRGTQGPDAMGQGPRDPPQGGDGEQVGGQARERPGSAVIEHTDSVA